MLKDDEKKYLTELARAFPDESSVMSEIVNLSAILELPKGTEHFMSDIHGEHEAFSHIRRNASGVIRKKIDMLFSNEMSEAERRGLASLVYYPEERLLLLGESEALTPDFYRTNIVQLLRLLRHLAEKYTRSKVEKKLKLSATSYARLLSELINSRGEAYRTEYYDAIIERIISVGAAEEFIVCESRAVRSLVIDKLHIVGDIFDRGPRADIVLDELMREESIDIQWGNHDALWMGAAAGSRTCIATVLNNSITYKNLDVVEIGYGISLRPLQKLATDVYGKSDISAFMPRGDSSGDSVRTDDDALIARMHKAISIIQFKLEGQTIKRNPDFNMEDRLLLDKIDRDRGVVNIRGNLYPLRDSELPTVDASDPYALTREEAEVMRYLKTAFMRSEKLARHVKFLFERGGMYTVSNKNLLFHGCIPIDKNGEFLSFPAAEGKCGRELMDFSDKMARCGYFSKEGSAMRQRGKDFLWFLWCGKNSPLAARERITTFERLFVADEKTWVEPKNPYYESWDNEALVDKILREFSLCGDGSHIINGHIPIKYKKGEEPIKAGGKLIVIDGGFSRAYRNTTGIGGCTLIYNADGMRISVHEPFVSPEDAVNKCGDILSESIVFDHADSKIRISDTDDGIRIKEKISDLVRLLSAYRHGEIKQKQSFT